MIEENWRSIILFGKNVASYKFAQLPNGKIYELNLDNIDYKQQREAFTKCMTE